VVVAHAATITMSDLVLITEKKSFRTLDIFKSI